MSPEMYEMIKEMDLNKMETQLVFQCAPLIAGLKIANLLTVQKNNLEQLQEIMIDTKISCCSLLETERKMTVLLYKKEELEAYLAKTEVRNFLGKMNYKDTGLDDILSLFCLRYRKYMTDKKVFPHEMGVFLGYPIEDVKGFMQHCGKNFLYIGYWKVYKNRSAKERLFQKYEQARETMICLAAQGWGIQDIIRFYNNDKLQNAIV